MRSVLDKVFALILIIILLPLFIVISLLVFIEDGCPIIFKQVRYGKNMKSFNIYKFRSMKNHAEKEFVATKENDNRILKLGKYLRKTRLDEIPQLFNILLGQMSFVGVRPDIDSHIEYYTNAQKKEYSKYRPGIYGLAAYVYKNEGLILNDVENKKEYYLNNLLPKKCELNKIYNDNKSFFLDIQILLASLNLKKCVKIKNNIFVPEKNVKG